ncbi:MAG TPA: phage holin family protein [Chitinophagaceae bacterium]|nr:phage holin family protein [Chitinophagaceae bacterium]
MEVEEPQQTKPLSDKTKDLTDHLGDYAENFYRLAVLNLTQKATNIASAAVTLLTLCTLGMFVLLFGSIALAWWMGDLVQSRAGGFLIVAGFYLVIVVVIIAIRKNIIFPYFRNAIIRKLYV